MIDRARRSPQVWIGLATASLAIVACLCALSVLVVLAGFRGGRFGAPATIPSPGPFDVTSTPSQPAAKATTPRPAQDDWPLTDVPKPAEADLGTLIGSADDFSVFTDQDFAEVLAFYQSEMDALGWSKVSYGTRITENDAELQFRKDDTHVTVILARIPFIGTLVEIHTQAV